ncbi:MAG: hypothetical protein WCL71_15835 [Deltaproteobacteria bacterium]
MATMVVNYGTARYTECIGGSTQRKSVALHPFIEFCHGESKTGLFFSKSVECICVNADFTICPLNTMPLLFNRRSDKKLRIFKAFVSR